MLAMTHCGSSVGRMPESQSGEPGFESPLLPFRSLGIFFHFTTPQSTQLYTFVTPRPVRRVNNYVMLNVGTVIHLNH